MSEDEDRVVIYPGYGHTTITVDEHAFTLEDLLDAMIDDKLEEFVLALPRRELNYAPDVDVVEVFREAAMIYLFR